MSEDQVKENVTAAAEKTQPATACRAGSDWKTFAISFLTAVIVVALYHFGCGLIKIYKGQCDGEYSMKKASSKTCPMMRKGGQVIYCMPVMCPGAMNSCPGKGFSKHPMNRPGFHHHNAAGPDGKRFNARREGGRRFNAGPDGKRDPRRFKPGREGGRKHPAFGRRPRDQKRNANAAPAKTEQNAAPAKTEQNVKAK